MMPAKTVQALTPNISPVGPSRWKTFIDNEELSCYSFYLPHGDGSAPADANDDEGDANENDHLPVFALASAARLDEWFRKLHPSSYNDDGSAWTDATYENRLLLRRTAWHTFDDECACEYGYSDTWQPLIRSREMIDVLREITRSVSKVVGAGNAELDCVNLNYYPRGGGVGFHADDEFLFDGLNRETRIVSLSLCSPAGDGRGDDVCEDADAVRNFGARIFQVKRKGMDRDSLSREVNEILLRHGDLMTMEGMFQKHYLHSVWPGDSEEHEDHYLCQGERINLTWRTIVRHLEGSENCRGLMCPLASRGS